MSARDVRCVGCGNFHSTEFIRCAICKTPTRVSRAAQPEPWPPEEPFRFARGMIWACALSAPIWAVLIWWLVA